ncbi:hypothetical protein [Nodosilinea nodulosa]|uniref:hypothetical protein n=1 Tax=Nodosilinea nodulosa TaxID=416001 RepID=UPI0012D807BE
MANVYLALCNCPKAYLTRKTWREDLEVALKIEGSQVSGTWSWVKLEHPLTAIGPMAEGYATLPIIMRLKMRHSGVAAAPIVGVRTLCQDAGRVATYFECSADNLNKPVPSLSVVTMLGLLWQTATAARGHACMGAGIIGGG